MNVLEQVAQLCQALPLDKQVEVLAQVVAFLQSQGRVVHCIFT